MVDWGKILTDVAGTVIVGVFGPPIIAAILAMAKPTRAWLSRPWIVAGLLAISIATIVSVVTWAVLPPKPPYEPIKFDVNKIAKNTSERLLFVGFFCNDTRSSDPIEFKTIEGQVGDSEPNLKLITSSAGTHRIAISFIVPPNWSFKPVHKPDQLFPKEGCDVTGWLL